MKNAHRYLMLKELSENDFRELLSFHFIDYSVSDGLAVIG